MPTKHRDAGKRFGHAWVEKGSSVYDVGSFPSSSVIEYPRDEYYRLFKIDRSTCASYSSEDAPFRMLREGHWGPWH